MPERAQLLPDKKMLKKDKGINLEVAQCAGCGLVQLRNNPPVYYREVIRAAAISKEMTFFREKQFRDFVKKYSLEKNKIIEIGCGCGEYLSLIKKTGVDVYGLEFRGQSVKQCTTSGLKVSKGFINNEGQRLDDAPFNAFFILSFLEHLPNPNTVLSGIYNNLKDDAVGIVEVPNFDMILKKKLFSEFIGDHLLYFTKETLCLTLKQNGFEIIECNGIWHDYILSVTVKKRNKLNLQHFYQCQKQLQKEIEKYTSCFRPKKVAIWGAGHQALTVISLTNLKDKIKYVIDSASFKQGKYTPATHIPIVSPETLKSDPVDAVIIVAGSYSDEVVRIIQEKYDMNKMNVVVLRDFGLEKLTIF